jgi:hypothetical protein
MKKHMYIVFAMIAVALMFPTFAQAFGMPTIPYGGKVLTTVIPTVTCNNLTGTAPVVLSSNLAGIGEIASGGVEGVVSGLYSIIPLYATSSTKTPRFGQWILGRHEIVPNFNTCNSTLFGGFPVPVKNTTTYGVSGGYGF